MVCCLCQPPLSGWHCGRPSLSPTALGFRASRYILQSRDIMATLHRCAWRKAASASLSIAEMRSQILSHAALTAVCRRVYASPSIMRATGPCERALTDEFGIGLNLAIPFAVQSGSLLSSYACAANLCAAKSLGAMLRAFKASAASSSRANSVRRKLVGSADIPSAFLPQCFFAGVQCFTLMPASSAMRARGTPLRSGRGGNGASPAAANSAATDFAWPRAKFDDSAPSGASNAGAAAAIVR